MEYKETSPVNYDYDKVLIFIHHTNRLNAVDIEKLTKKEITVNVSENIDNRICMCIIPGNKIFCYGNLLNNGKYTGITFIIDSSYRVKQLSRGFPCVSSSAIYYNGQIYTFGGFNGTCLSLSKRFDLASNRWAQSANNSMKWRACSIAIFLDQFIIAGFGETKAFIYDPLLDSFSLLPLETLVKSSIKVNCVANDRAYVIDSLGYVYESDPFNLYSWSQFVNAAMIGTFIFSYPVIYKDSLYFVLDYKLYRFYFSLKKSRKVLGEVIMD
ncbi:unnamed protein product [Blepharisma stoltei]|uniref:Kelch-like protein n=1 Tax=Blepharisma stoltei TaxID=1481888 RepID=A0AAU9IFE7_9CILI|nr:unnamed protein product [Blepharisma stoltei]